MKERHKRLLPKEQFLKKLFLNILISSSIIFFSLLLGMLGYHHFEKLNWIDSYLNASMILSGMGPASELKTDAGKIFAGTYALFSGILFLIVIAFMLAPIFHRFIHKLHLEYDSD